MPNKQSGNRASSPTLTLPGFGVQFPMGRAMLHDVAVMLCLKAQCIVRSPLCLPLHLGSDDSVLFRQL